MKNIIILSEKSWNQDLVKTLKKNNNKFNWILINHRNKFSINNLNVLKPAIIFIPHWSYIIPAEIHEKYECIVFHMTDLPFGRGGSPLQNLIIRGYKDTKISAIKVEKGLDCGDIYLKKKLSLNGSAKKIFERANLVIETMIIDILENDIKPIPQKGKVTLFKRRMPEKGNINNIKKINKVYDYIRMLDADGYPSAYLENKFLKFEFTDANFENNNEIIAQVRIKTKKNEK